MYVACVQLSLYVCLFVLLLCHPVLHKNNGHRPDHPQMHPACDMGRPTGEVNVCLSSAHSQVQVEFSSFRHQKEVSPRTVPFILPPSQRNSLAFTIDTPLCQRIFRLFKSHHMPISFHFQFQILISTRLLHRLTPGTQPHPPGYSIGTTRPELNLYLVNFQLPN